MNKYTFSFAYFLEYLLLFLFDKVDEKCELRMRTICLVFATFSLALLIKVLRMKKACILLGNTKSNY